MPWFYSSLDNHMFLYSPYVLPGKPPNLWNGKQCKAFLKSRSYPGYSKMKADESKAVVSEMLSQPNWPPPESIPSSCSVHVEDLQNMVWHCHTLFKNLFAAPHQPAHLHAADGHAKLLLSTITRLDRLMHPHESLPNLYEVKYNFISLPRAVSLLSVHGSARNIQEGGTDGEGVVKMLRPLTPRGLKDHFARNLMDAYHRDQQLQELCDEVGSHLSSDNGCAHQQRKVLDDLAAVVEAELDASEDVPELDDDILEDTDDDNMEKTPSFAMDTQQFKTYRTIGLLQEYRKLGLPLSFVVATVHNKSCIGFVVGNGMKRDLISLCINGVAYPATTGFSYFDITIDYNEDASIPLFSCGPDGIHMQHHSVLQYGHLLPHLATLDNSMDLVPYAVVTTDGNSMDASFQF